MALLSYRQLEYLQSAFNQKGCAEFTVKEASDLISACKAKNTERIALIRAKAEKRIQRKKNAESALLYARTGFHSREEMYACTGFYETEREFVEAEERADNRRYYEELNKGVRPL